MYQPINLNPQANKSFRKSQKMFKLVCLLCALIMFIYIKLNLDPNKTGRYHLRTSYLQSQLPSKTLISEEKQQWQKNNLKQQTTSAQNPTEELIPSSHQTIDSKMKKIINQQHRGLAYKNLPDSEVNKELPFCVVATAESVEKVKQSINRGIFTNFKIITPLSEQASYREIKDRIAKECSENSVIILVRGPLANGALEKLNIIYQTKQVWLTYSVVGNHEYAVSSFYGKLFKSLQLNDFKKEKDAKFSLNVNFIILSLLELGKMHSEKVEYSDIFSSKTGAILSSSLETLGEMLPYHQPYQPMFSLSQNYRINERELDIQNQLMLGNNRQEYQQQGKITQEQMLEAFEYLELKNLPKNHSLFAKNRDFFSKKYGLQHGEKEVPLCVYVPSTNNLENSRYQNVLKTILYQEYSNYHIVFTDEYSTDQTLKETKKYLESVSFPKERITYLQTPINKSPLENIFTAVNKHCQSGEVFVVVDGSDELIGTQIFALLNREYAENQNWVVYTNFVNSDKTYGTSNTIPATFFDNPRHITRIIGSLQTYSVDLLRRIKEKDLKDSLGRYYNSLAYEIIQYPALEMSRAPHTKYIPEICYYKHKKPRHDSTKQEKQARDAIVKDLLSKQKYQQQTKLLSTEVK